MTSALNIGLHGYTPRTSRETFGLKVEHPMVAPSYALKRSELAKPVDAFEPSMRKEPGVRGKQLQPRN